MALLRAGRPPRGALPKTAPRAAHVRGRRSRAYPDAALAHRCVARQGHPLERSLTSRTHPIVCTAHTPWQHPHRPHMTSTTRIHAPAQKQHRLSFTPAAPGPKRSTIVRPCSPPLPCRRLVRKLGGEVGAAARNGQTADGPARQRWGAWAGSAHRACLHALASQTHTHSQTSTRAIAAPPPTISCPTTPLPEAPPKCWRGSRSSSSAAVRGEHALKLLDHLCCELVARLCAGEQGGHALHLPAGAAVGAGHQAVLGEDGGQHLK